MIIFGNMLNIELCCPESLLEQTNKKILKKHYQSNSLLMLHLNSTILKTEAKKEQKYLWQQANQLTVYNKQITGENFSKAPAALR